ncbi:MAG: hypothetical protein K6U80_14890 [Firmicutes bacterium]|nr:hypothetical protein [Bacillota bacterium]
MRKTFALIFNKLVKIGLCLLALLVTPVILSAANIEANLARDGSRTIPAIFFYSQTCPDCRLIQDEFLPELRRKYQGQLEIKPFEITSEENFEFLLKLEKKLGRKINKTPPLIIIGSSVLQGEKSIRAKMEAVIAKRLAAKGKDSGVSLPIALNRGDSQGRWALGQFHSLTPLAVIAGGLLDGINPCAFTTLIFLISYLAMLGRNRKELVLAGASFTVGVFMAYFLIGYGLLEALGQVPFFTKLSKWFAYVLASALILLSLLNLYDYFLVKQGKYQETKLQLSNFLKLKIHKVIRERSRIRRLSAGFMMGFLVALLEFPCTGQVYFPVILILRGNSALRFTAFWYLVLYNLMFILPLTGVFGLAYWGTTSNQIAQMTMKHLGKIKLLFAIFFGLLALILFLTVH